MGDAENSDVCDEWLGWSWPLTGHPWWAYMVKWMLSPISLRGSSLKTWTHLGLCSLKLVLAHSHPLATPCNWYIAICQSFPRLVLKWAYKLSYAPWFSYQLKRTIAPALQVALLQYPSDFHNHEKIFAPLNVVQFELGHASFAMTIPKSIGKHFLFILRPLLKKKSRSM